VDSKAKSEGRGHVAYHVVPDTTRVVTGTLLSPIVTVLQMERRQQTNVTQVGRELRIVPFRFNYSWKEVHMRLFSLKLIL
jgi:hypothetical protein